MNNIKCGLLSEIKSILINHYDERLKCELTKTALINQWLHAVEDRINTHGEEDQILQDLPHQLRRLNSLSTGDDVAIDLDPSDFTDIFIPARVSLNLIELMLPILRHLNRQVIQLL